MKRQTISNVEEDNTYNTKCETIINVYYYNSFENCTSIPTKLE